ncbi:two pore domain potassium channel family protein [Duncaniella muris]|nr:two pore domain potassium channel family protein [Duncaniella muris]
MKMMHLGVVILSLLLITLITLDTLRNVSFLADTTYLKVQFWCCLFFMADVFVEMLFSVKKRKYLINHLFFLLVSVPYLNILHYFDIPLDNHAEYLLKFVPMIRAAYVFTIVTGATTSSKWVKNMLATYLIVLIVGVYFCSLTFFVAENGVNPDVTDYWSSLLWSIMSLTTAGCSIHAMTVTGRVLGVVLSAVGLIFFPIFTVFLTNSYTSEQDAGGTTSDKQG